MYNKFVTYIVFVLALFTVSFSSNAFASNKTVKQPVRALHFVLRGISMNDAKRMIDIAQVAGFNTVILALADAVNLRSYPGKPLEDAWTAEELKLIVTYATHKKITVIPEIKLLTHQEKFFGTDRPELMFNLVTYDPRVHLIYEVVYRYCDEIIRIMRPVAIHIGHDEVAGYNPWSQKKMLRSGEQMLPAELFYDDVTRIHAYLKKKGVKTWMWGDMLISSDEFPSMRPNHLHGDAPGYGKELRNKLSRDIVICDWHYNDEQSDFPSLAAIRENGFAVLGATWENLPTIKNFSSFARNHGGGGMVATTWFYVQRKEWDVVRRIIRDSGEIFRRDFPDAK